MAFAVPTEFPTGNSTFFEPVPADNHPGVCIGLIDLGTHMESYQGGPSKAVRKIKLQFELPGVHREDGKSAIISATYNYSMHEKSTFRKMLDSWLGADWTERYKGRPWEFILGIPAMVNVEQGKAKKDPSRTVSWIASISKYPKGLPVPQGTRDTFYLDLSDKVLPEKLSFFDAKKIRESAEYLEGNFADYAPKTEEEAKAKATGQRPTAANASASATPSAVAGVGTTALDIPAQAPPHIAPLLPKYGLRWSYSVDELDAIRDDITPKDYALLEPYAVPF